MDRFRIDKWLWAARFFKTRALAAEEIGKGRVLVNEQVAKASRELRDGDTVEFRQAGALRTVVVLALTRQRGPGPRGAGPVRRDRGQHRAPGGRSGRAEAAPGAGRVDRPRPADQAQPARAGRLEPLERLDRTGVTK